jgi:hypothetical protein
MDHDHRTGEARMLLCSVCNHDVLGHYRDRPLDLLRLALALVDPPSRVAWTGLNLAPPTWHTKDPGALLWIECRLQGAEGCT